MQSVNYYIPVAFLTVVTLVTYVTCSPTTAISGITTSTLSPNETLPTNGTTTEASSIQNDESKVEPTSTVAPTKLPLNESATLPSKPSIIHDITTVKTPGVMPQTTNGIPNVTATTANTKHNEKDGASRGSPGFLVTILVLLSLSVIFT